MDNKLEHSINIDSPLWEVGSDFHLSNRFLLEIPQEVPLSGVYFSSGRGALYSILHHLKEQGLTRFLLPGYLCDSILQPFRALGLAYQFYHIGLDLRGDRSDFAGKIASVDVVYILDYFGGVDSYRWLEPFLKGKQVIHDVTHSLLNLQRSDLTGDRIYLASLRKWLGISDGAVVYHHPGGEEGRYHVEESSFVQMKLRGMEGKALYLRQGGAKEYLVDLQHAEEQLDRDSRPGPISKLARDTYERADWSAIRAAREQNCAVLHRSLSGLPGLQPVLDWEAGQTPMGFVIASPWRDALRQYLTAHRIYCPIHWPLPVERKDDEGAKRLFASLLTIPCDQRYTPDDMQQVVNIIRKFGESIA